MTKGAVASCVGGAYFVNQHINLLELYFKHFEIELHVHNMHTPPKTP